MNLSKNKYGMPNKYAGTKIEAVNNSKDLKNNVSYSNVINATSLAKSGVHPTLSSGSKLSNVQQKNTSNYQSHNSVMHNSKCMPPNYKNEADNFSNNHSLDAKGMHRTKLKSFNDINRCLNMNTEERKIFPTVERNLNTEKTNDKDDGWITVKSNNLKKRNFQNLPNELPKSSSPNLGNITSTGSPKNRTIINETKHKLSLNKSNLQFQGRETKNQIVVQSMKSKPLQMKNDSNSSSVLVKNNNITKSKKLDCEIVPNNTNSTVNKNYIQNNYTSCVKSLLNETKPEIAEDQQKVQARLLKKLKIKEDKKRKREDKARLLRDNLRRDTKINFISQETIEKYSNSSTSNNYNAAQILTKKQTSYNFNAALEEYPTMNLGRNSQGFRPAENVDNNAYLCGKTLSMEKLEAQSCRTGIVSINKPYIEFYKENEDEEKSFGTKKKVKTKDRMNLAIISLLEIKQNEKKKDTKVKSNVESSPVKPVIELRGKVRENSEKKLSTLKKNILREKKRQEELLFALLKDESHNVQPKNDSNLFSKMEENTRFTQSEIIEQNKFTPHPSKDVAEPVDINKHPSDSQVTISSTSSPTNKIVKLVPKESYIISNTDSFINEDATSERKLPNSIIVEDNNNLESLPSKLPVCQKKIENSDIIKEINKLLNPVHSKKFREYCDQIVTPEINSILTDLIQHLVKFQDRLYQQDPLKAKVKRRFYCGLKESKKHMNKVVCIVMAPNLKPSPGPGCVDELVMKVLNGAAESGIPIVFGLSNRQIGRLCHKKVPVSCFSIVNYHGAKDLFDSLMDLLPEAKKQYQDLVSSRGLNVAATCIENDTLEEIIPEDNNITASLLKSLRDKE